MADEKCSNESGTHFKRSQLNASVVKVKTPCALSPGALRVLQWAQRVTRGYPGVSVTNFTTSWRDGLAFNAILNRYRPDLINWREIRSCLDTRQRLERAFVTAERKFGIKRLLDPGDVDVQQPDEKSMMVYIYSFYDALPEQPGSVELEPDISENRTASSEICDFLVHSTTSMMQDRAVPFNAVEIRLLDKLDRFKTSELPQHLRDKQKLEQIYSELDILFGDADHTRARTHSMLQNLIKVVGDLDNLTDALQQAINFMDNPSAAKNTKKDIEPTLAADKLIHGDLGTVTGFTTFLKEWELDARKYLETIRKSAKQLISADDAESNAEVDVEMSKIDVEPTLAADKLIHFDTVTDLTTFLKEWELDAQAYLEKIRNQRSKDQMTYLHDRESLLDNLLHWLDEKEAHLMAVDEEQLPIVSEDFDGLVLTLLNDHEKFEAELKSRQPDVEKMTKRRKKFENVDEPTSTESIKTAPPNRHIAVQLKAHKVADKWSNIWLSSNQRKSRLMDLMERLREFQESKNFDFHDWRQRFLGSMNLEKVQLMMDRFRRQDKENSGKVTRQEFINGILASNVCTTQLEMEKVVNVFDNDHRGFICYRIFCDALCQRLVALKTTDDILFTIRRRR